MMLPVTAILQDCRSMTYSHPGSSEMTFAQQLLIAARERFVFQQGKTMSLCFG